MTRFTRCVAAARFGLLLLVASLSLFLVNACGPGAGGSFGATQAGAQDIGNARTTIIEGFVPLPESVTTEGLFSEHELRLEGEPSEDLLSLNLGAGVLIEDEGYEPRYFVQVATTSNLTEETFERAPLNISLVLDRSGSMRGEKMFAAIDAAQRIVDQLADDDYFSLVTFNHESQVRIPAQMVGGPAMRDELKWTISRVTSSGSTDMNQGMVTGYNEIRKNISLEGYSHRQLLLTDALPNTGNFTDETFVGLVSKNADEDIGLTALGFGIDFGVELANQIFSLHNCNYRFVPDSGSLYTVVDQDFDMLVTPLAHDMLIDMDAAPGFEIVGVHGAPGWEFSPFNAQVEVASLFLSRRGGAIVIELAQVGEVEVDAVTGAFPLGTFDMSYTDLDGVIHTVSGGPVLDGDAEGSDWSFTHNGVMKSSVLAIQAERMREALTLYHEGDHASAIEMLAPLPELLRRVYDQSADLTFETEAKMIEQLMTNMGAE